MFEKKLPAKPVVSEVFFDGFFYIMNFITLMNIILFKLSIPRVTFGSSFFTHKKTAPSIQGLKYIGIILPRKFFYYLFIVYSIYNDVSHSLYCDFCQVIDFSLLFFFLICQTKILPF